jgi:hypothetical protein
MPRVADKFAHVNALIQHASNTYVFFFFCDHTRGLRPLKPPADSLAAGSISDVPHSARTMQHSFCKSLLPLLPELGSFLICISSSDTASRG